MQLRLTASQLVELSGIPRGSLGFYISSGLLQPSVRRARGKGQPHVFGFRELVVARAIAQLRTPGISIEPMRALADYWRSLPGAKVLDKVSAEAEKTKTTTHEEVLLLLADGRLVVEQNQPILELTRKLGSVLHVLDPGELVKTVTLEVTDIMMRLGLPQPGPGGRLPREKTDVAGRSRRMRKEAAPTAMREASQREAKSTRTESKKKR